MSPGEIVAIVGGIVAILAGVAAIQAALWRWLIRPNLHQELWTVLGPMKSDVHDLESAKMVMQTIQAQHSLEIDALRRYVANQH